MLARKQEFNLKLEQIADSVLLALSFWGAWQLRTSVSVPLQIFAPPPLDKFYWQMLVLVPFTPVALEQFGYYTHPLEKTLLRSLGQLLKCLIAMVLVTALIGLIGKQEAESRAVLLIFPGIAIPALICREALTRWWLKRKGGSMIKERVILAGPPEDQEKLLASLGPEQVARMDILARIDISTAPITELITAMHDNSIERVIFAAAHVHLHRIEEAVGVCETEGVEAWLWAGFIQTSIARPTFDALGGKPMLVFRCTPEISWALFIKSIIDRTGAFFSLILAAPLLLAAWIGIKIASPGPVIFTQMRSGRHGRPFKMYKFRTMCTDAEQKKQELMDQNQMSGPVFKVDRDPRIFPLGHILRKFSIDELPQLLNVFNGDMSLVGPRPLPVYEVEKFAEASHRRRLSMKPGLTCLWQVSGRNEITSFDQWVELDLKYIDNWSLLLDVSILLRTIPVVFRGAGAK